MQFLLFSFLVTDTLKLLRSVLLALSLFSCWLLVNLWLDFVNALVVHMSIVIDLLYLVDKLLSFLRWRLCLLWWSISIWAFGCTTGCLWCIRSSRNSALLTHRVKLFVETTSLLLCLLSEATSVGCMWWTAAHGLAPDRSRCTLEFRLANITLTETTYAAGRLKRLHEVLIVSTERVLGDAWKLLIVSFIIPVWLRLTC